METCATIRNVSNQRIADRNIPSQPLQTYLDVRPVQTKYTLLPIVDVQPPATVEIKVQPTYNTSKIFSPGNRESPWSGFATNVDVESVLRSQIFALQKCSQAIYVPSSTSDLYVTHMMEEKDLSRHPLFVSYASSPYTCKNENNHPSNFTNLYKNPHNGFSPTIPREVRFGNHYSETQFHNSTRLLR
jgi:hypothetical protein